VNLNTEGLTEIAEMMPKIIQITSAEAYYTDTDGHKKKHMTLFALDEDGCIWTRYYDGRMYREWYTVGMGTDITRSK